jgi:hypothetical protein
MITGRAHTKRLLQFGTADLGLGRPNSPRVARALARASETRGGGSGMLLAELRVMTMKDPR